MRKRTRLPALIWVLTLIAASLAGCAALAPPPDIKSMYIGASAPTPRPDSAIVEVFLQTNPPERVYTTVGEVEIATERSGRSMEEMLRYAQVEARKMGGDALIVATTSASTPTKTKPVHNLYTGELMYYRSESGTRRTVKGTVIVWKDED